MSDAIRSYRPSRRTYHEGPTRSGGVIRWIVLLFFVVGCLWLVWTTRDSCPVERVIPQNQSFHFQVRDLLSTRQEIAHSPLWDTGLVPANYAGIPTWIANSFGYPDWILNNLVSDVCYVSGTDLMAFSDLLVVTRMSRIGCLLERYHRFLDAIEDEHAGGLALRKLSGVNFYYAVRGRTIVFSPSRDAIIQALTLRESDAVTSLETAGMDVSGDLQGRMAFSADEPLGQFFERSDCRLDFEAASITFSSRSVLKPDWRAPLDGLGLSQSPGELLVPRNGGVLLAGEFGVPLTEVWLALDEMTAGAMNDYVSRWGALDQLSASEQEAFQATFSLLSRALGTSFSLRTAGFDLDGMVPMPIFDLSLQPTADVVNAALKAASGSIRGTLPKNGVPYIFEEDGIARLSLGWGDVIEPSAFWDGPLLRTSLHPEHVAVLREIDNLMVPASGNGHLFFRLRLGELMDTIGEGVFLYAENGMIRGQTADTLNALSSEVGVIAGRVPEISVMLNYLDGELAVELRLELTETE
jgi:hypothetical protein